MAYQSTRLVATTSLVAALIGCGNSAHDGSNSTGGSGTSTSGTGNNGNSGGSSNAGTAANAGSGTTAKTGGTGGSSGSGGAPASGGSNSLAGGGGSSGMTATAGSSAGGSSGVGAGGASGASGNGAGGSAGAAVTGGLTLTIDPNPNSVLSCFVSWKTDQASNSVVQFGEAAYDFEISDDTLVTDHKVLVIGMHASKSYMIKAISGSASGTGTFMTGTLPAQIPVGTVMINDTSKSVAGWTLMNVQQGGTDNRPRSSVPPAAVMYDAGGQPVWYYIDGPGPDIGGAVSTQLTDTGVVIGPTWNQQNTNGVPPREVDFAGNIIWECKHAACAAGKDVTHETKKLSNGHYVILEYVGSSAQNPVFRELDADSNEVWTFDWVSLLPAPSGSTGDWCHANAITIDIAKNEVYANCRWVGLMKATYTNPTKTWLIPAKYGSKGLGDFTFVPSTSQYDDAHDPEYHDDDNTVLFYDNGGWSGSVDTVAGGDYHSRAVEYTIDASAGTATLTWEYPGSFTPPDDWYTTKWYSPFWGDVDRLSNGNILITGGMIGASKPESRVFEVTKADGKVVWELRLPVNFGVYRSDRITPPLVHAAK